MNQTTESRHALETLAADYKKWFTDLAQPAADKRRQLDGGMATIAELQIFYLNHDPEVYSAKLDRDLEDVLVAQKK